MKKIFIALAACVLFASCAIDYKYTDRNGNEKIAHPYGWADYKYNHADGIEYRLCITNVALSFIFCETLVVPIWLTGWQLFEPVGIEGNVELPSFIP